MKTINLFGKKCSIEFGTYLNNTVAITANHRNQPFMTCTVNYESNWEGARPYSKEFSMPRVVIKNYGENEGVIEMLKTAGVIKEGGAYLSGSSGTVEVRVLTPEWEEDAKRQIAAKS